MATASFAAAASSDAVIPAQVGFLAIFNPSLGNTDDTLDDQIVYYSSVDINPAKRRRHVSKQSATAKATENVSHEERNERLRQIGLAQGIVGFSRDFSGNQSVDTIDTEKTRVVLHELEPGWWILACIDLTRLTLPAPAKKSKDGEESSDPKFEYSSREVKPAALLLQDMLRAHSTFLLHHDSSLSALFVRIKRARFTTTLARYWDLYLASWNVLLHGNPIRDIFGGIKVAASGELGMGVGEEERGSGEREVLESLKGRIDGLVDVVVSKFGDCHPDDDAANEQDHSTTQWLGTGREPGAEDGAIFLGVGTLSKKSVRDITYWMEDIYRWGSNAYGVLESPKGGRRTHRGSGTESKKKAPTADSMQIPPSLFDANRGTQASSSYPTSGCKVQSTASTSEFGAQDEGTGLERYMDYFKLGYGKYWSLGRETDTGGSEPHSLGSQDARPEPARRPSRGSGMTGHFLVGLTGEVEEGWIEDPEERRFALEHEELNARILVRTLMVELDAPTADKPLLSFSRVLGSQDTELSSRNGLVRPVTFDSQDRNKTQRLRVVVYVLKPFVFTLLFEVRTESLAFDGLYRSLHHQLAPLRKPLANSATYRPDKPDIGKSSAAIYDLVWDPRALTVHSTIPSIPDPVDLYSIHEQPFWSRVEALNTHTQVLNLWKAARGNAHELERTCKTSRGWWIVWSRILDQGSEQQTMSSTTETGRPFAREHRSTTSSMSSVTEYSDVPSDTVRNAQGFEHGVSKEIFLLRKASDHADGGNGGGGHGRSLSLAAATTGTGWADGASRLAQGIGVDTRKYIEGLLSLNR
ncbi:hypothetical protein BD289DRAFT_480377 [Coniella lustricola]|uniref:CCZ1/INTU/HSP4 first Longin domain-containing protein n=1 Tax=Coniella lustricola TaxID=2025994 RepID=A0A2T3AG29_9PEZI|nr:hypothetical protein BD289DRAFT_480377 [Coniella lustricola]